MEVHEEPGEDRGERICVDRVAFAKGWCRKPKRASLEARPLWAQDYAAELVSWGPGEGCKIRGGKVRLPFQEGHAACGE